MTRSGSLIVLALLLWSGCQTDGELERPSTGSGVDATATYEVRGVVQSVDGKYLTVDHENIPGYMDAMTMAFVVADTAEVPDMAEGDSIAFELAVTEMGDRIYSIVPY